MQPHIANILRDILQKPHRMMPGGVVEAERMLDTLKIEAEALALALGRDELDALAAQFLVDCGKLPTDGIRNADGSLTEQGQALEHIDHMGYIIIARMGGDPWFGDTPTNQMTKLLNRLHYGQMEMDATLQAALGHPGAHPMADLQASGAARASLGVGIDANPMHWAVNSNKPKLVRTWAKHGMDPQVRDAKNRTPMSRATSADMVSTLLELGASLDDVDGQGTWAPDHWKNIKLSDTARMQMMGKAMTHLLDGDKLIDKTTLMSMVENLPAVKKLQAAMDRSGLSWWDDDDGLSPGRALCCYCTIASVDATSSATKRMQSLLGAAQASPGSEVGDNPALMKLAMARLRVNAGQRHADQDIGDGQSAARALALVLEHASNTMPKGLATLKAMCSAARAANEMATDGLVVDRCWLGPVSRMAGTCMQMGAVGDGDAIALVPWLADAWGMMDGKRKADLMPALVPLVFYASTWAQWGLDAKQPLLEAIMDTDCQYIDAPEKQEELQRNVDALRDFGKKTTSAGMAGKIAGVVARLDAKSLQASCAKPTTSGRAGPRF